MPNSSVRRTVAPVAAARSSISACGWPKLLPAPAETTTICGDDGKLRQGKEAVEEDEDYDDNEVKGKFRHVQFADSRRRHNPGSGKLLLCFAALS